MSWSDTYIRDTEAAYRAWSLRRAGPYHLRRAKHAGAVQALRAKGADFFVVHGAGRSGTQLITSLINARAGALVPHKPDFDDDVRIMAAVHADPVRGDAYWLRFRAARVMARWGAVPDAELYGEVTGMLRHHVQSISRLFPSAQQFLLSRDPAGFVRSLMGWPKFYSDGSRGAYALSPAPDHPLWPVWPEMSRFEKCCWAWADTYARLSADIDVSFRLRLEDLVSDYALFQTRVDAPLHLDIDEVTWQRIVSTPSRNVTKSYGFPAYPDWTAQQKAAFARICGPTMRDLGYIA